MVVPPKSQDITFEEFLKELPDEYHEMAYDFKAFTRSRKIKTPAQLLQVVMLITDWTMFFEKQRG